MPKLVTVLLFACLGGAAAGANASRGAADFHKQVRPILERYCFDCHADGANKGNVAFDEFKSDQAAVESRDLWLKALKMLRAGLMPPANKQRPDSQEREQIVRWVKYDVLALDPKHPDPGRVTVRRLNRVEYHNTIHDLLGVDFDAESEFPPDDTGFGFDDIGDVLTLSPMLLEKYIAAANKVVGKALASAPADTGRDKEGPPGAGRFRRYFAEPVPGDGQAQRESARKFLADFSGAAFRRPADAQTVERLLGLAGPGFGKDRESFQAGIGRAMVAVLASPRFLFREEAAEPAGPREPYPLIDEYSLASRLSYFLWSSTPDDELLRLAGQGSLRKNLAAQAARMLGDARAQRFVRNFTGQWLRGRDIETVPIEAEFVLAREHQAEPELERSRKRFHELRDKSETQLSPAEREELTRLRTEFRRRLEHPGPVALTGELRRAMRKETEAVFGYILREDRSLLELIDSNYTFLNERLAKHYGITNVSGDDMRLVQLPPDSPRGGVLTEGTVLVTSSNPTRTSPVKRGVFLLDNILGTPVPPPPPNIPPLEDAGKQAAGHTPSLRETLAAHRQNALCSSCHNRMDPLGLAFENFNALGMWRDSEFSQPIDPSGQLSTGESFSDLRELKQVLVKNHATDFYRTFTEKLLVYALGRGLEYYDVETVDQLVSRLEKAGGRPSALISGVIESAPFQRMRRPGPLTASTGPGRPAYFGK